ncbi:hypothetical protein ACH9L7_00710 [Haloferax sp. S1W]|uniref:hypothetical protein n=1 Tax=Haloferax sp. S1W TaxID=3377110 RepID=UPI0037C8490E
MSRIALQAVIVAGLILLAGCVSAGPPTAAPPASSTAQPTTTPATSTPTTATTTTATSTTGYSHGTQFVSVSKSGPGNCSSETTNCATFENLTADQQQVFRNLLNASQIVVGPDETNPFDYQNESRPEFVNYEGTWYFVRVAIK